MAFTLYHNAFWPVAQAARVALLEQGDACTLKNVDIAAGGLANPEFLKLSPTGTLPVIVDDAGPGGIYSTWDAMGVAAHLHNKRIQGQQSPVLYPVCPDGIPPSYAWTSWALSHLTPAMETLLLHGKILTGNARDQAKMGPALVMFRDGMAALERHIQASSFVNYLPSKQNGLFSFADAVIGSTLTYGRLIPQLKMKLDDYPKAYAYLQGLENRPSFKTAFAGVTLAAAPPNIEFPQ